MRTHITALLVVWLLVGCASPEKVAEQELDPRDTYLAFCPEVMHEIYRYHDGFDRPIESDNPAHLDQVRNASLRMAGLAELASRRVKGPAAVEGQWLADLGVAAEAFYQLSTPESSTEEHIMAFDALYYGVIRAEAFCEGAAL